MTGLFLIGAGRAVATQGVWWKSGLETLIIGAGVAAAAHGAGRLVAMVAT